MNAFRYGLANLIELLPTALWTRLGRSRWCGWLAGGTGDRVSPWWYDVAVALILLVACWLGLATFLGTPSATLAFVAALLLVDMVAHHLRVLWLDDLRAVGHGRQIVHAGGHFAGSIPLFSVLYEREACVREPPPAVYDASLRVATRLHAPDALSDCAGLVWSQVALSVFFLVVLVAVIRSAVSARRGRRAGG